MPAEVVIRSPSNACSSVRTLWSKSLALFTLVSAHGPKNHFSLISPSNGTLRPSSGISSIMRGWSVSSPFSLPASSALPTACSISRCELTPTILRNLRMPRLNVSWSMGGTPVGLREGSVRRLRRSRKHLCGQLLAVLNAPLVETVDVPDDALHENLVLVQRNQAAERSWIEAIERDDRRR